MSDGSSNKIGYKNPPKATQFKPGHSGNPSGLPKGTPKVSIALMKLLAEDASNEFAPKSGAEKIAWALYQKAVGGDVAAIREISDRTEGKSPATLNVNRNDAKGENYRRIVSKIVEKYGAPKEQVIRDLIEKEPEAAPYFDEWIS
jgi:uncharacterized protein DUF5681